MSKPQNWTGERLETFINNQHAIEHLHRYAIALGLCSEKVVLDIACGEGYGSNLLSHNATKVYGVDIDGESINAAKKKYLKANIEFLQGSTSKIPLEENSVDVVVSFETLEHHDEHIQMMLEVKRVLKSDGMFIISTPDKKYYSDEINYKNPFHLKELYFQDFKNLLSENFKYCSFFYQNMFSGSLVIPEKNVDGVKFFGGNYASITEEPSFKSIYLMCIASDKLFEDLSQISTFNGTFFQQKLDAARDLEIKEHTVSWLKKSYSYKLGHALLAPFRIFKK